MQVRNQQGQLRRVNLVGAKMSTQLCLATAAAQQGIVDKLPVIADKFISKDYLRFVSIIVCCTTMTITGYQA